MIKKIVSFSLLISLVLALAAFNFVSATTGADSAQNTDNTQKINNLKDLMKIPNLGEMKNYIDIIKKDGSLYGKLKEAMMEKNQEKISSILEKIANPDEIKNFIGVKKMGTALYGYRKMYGYRAVPAESVACVKSAIEIKDTAAMQNNTDFTTKLNQAIASRTTCQTTAIASSSPSQKDLVKTCVKTFQTALKQAKDEYKKKFNENWKLYLNSLKECAKLATSTPVILPVEASASFTIDDGGGNLDAVISGE